MKRQEHKPLQKKLVLTSQTIRALCGTELQAADGGVVTDTVDLQHGCINNIPRQ